MAYVIGDDCIACGTCQGECPVEAISEGEKYSIYNQNKKPLNRAAFYFGYSFYLMSRICWAGA